jgi:nitroreductase
MGTAGFSDQVPVLGVIVGQLRGYSAERDRHAIYVDGGLFAMGTIFALEAQGVSSCCINWPDLPQTDRRMRSLLDLEPDERIVMLLAMGYERPGQLVPRSHKRSPDSIVDWI